MKSHEVRRLLLLACHLYRSHEISLDKYKADIWSAVGSLADFEDAEFRNFLIASEAELDSVQYTTDSSEIFDATLTITRRIEERVRGPRDASEGS